MGLLEIQGVTHWSIPEDNLDEAEEFYGGILGLKSEGRWGNNTMSCYSTDGNNILLCAQKSPAGGSPPGVHHSFTVTPEILDQACKVFKEKGVKIDSLVYRAKGHFTGRELYFFDPSGNRLELRDPTWHEGMPEPDLEELSAL